ncbi:hypothetical protein [Nostoc sp.]|uniref:hypothetical protein n=1 Tax=Nostoc sp. TaxID=1180 RepID=UPI002FFB5285
MIYSFTISNGADIASAEVILLWYSNNLQGLGTNLLDVDDCSSTSRTRKTAGSMKQLGRAKRQKSCSTGGDVETPPSTQ